MKKSVAASEKPVKAKEFDKELFKRSVEYNEIGRASCRERV